MPKIKFIGFDGSEYDVEATVGQAVMEAAVQHLVPGIDADCGGAAACGTCHVYVDPAWFAKAGQATPGIEQDMLQLTDNVQENSRLSCQVKMDETLNGLVVHIPQAQH